MLKVQAILHDGSVALEFMTDDPSEAEEMRRQNIHGCYLLCRVLKITIIKSANR